MLDILSDAGLVALVGMLGGIVLGLAARLGRFCTLGAIEDTLYGNNPLRLQMWGIAIAVAIIGTFSLSALGALDLSDTLYLAHSWNPLAHIIGGLMFGYGMALAGNCGFGALARLGGGDMRSFVIVLGTGLSAYIALGGPLSALRLQLFETSVWAEETASLAQLIATGLGVSGNSVGIVIGLLLLSALLLSTNLRAAPKMLIWGTAVGLAVTSGWAGTAWVARHGFDATSVVSHTFSAPIGETMLYVMTSSGNAVSFGTGSVAGVLLGALLGSLIKGHFRWEACEDPRELRRQILGAAIMGPGAVIAVGCSIGQGMSAFSVLAISAPLTGIAIFAGAALGLRQLIVGFDRIA